MRLYFLSYSYETGITPDIGGFRKLWELADKLQQSGHFVRIFFPNISNFYPLKNIPYTRYFILSIRFLRPITAYIMMFFFALIKGFKEKPDIIYFRTSPNIFAVILGKILRTKIFLEINANFRDFQKTVHVSGLRNWYLSFTERFNILSSDIIIVLTEGLKEELVSQYNISPEKVKVISSGTDTKHFYPKNTSEIRKKIGISPTSKIIGFVGIFYPHQGVDTLIYAAKTIISKETNVHFLIIGDGVMRETWENLTKTEGVEKNFIFTGQVSYEKVPEYFNIMDIVVAPFTANRGETSPFKVLDALACGKTVVSSDLPSMKHLAEEIGNPIVLVPAQNPDKLAEVILELLNEKTKLKQLGEQGRKSVIEKYDWEVIAKQLEKVIS